MENTPVFSVSELNQSCRALLESHFPKIWVEGEISNFSAPGSGHFYFSLKDPHAQIRCAMFRSDNKKLKAQPEDGMQVKVLAKVSLYLNRGDFQLIVEKLEAHGEGLLKKAYEKLVKQLASKGLFQQKYKKVLPTQPQHIGIITSPTGAAIRDMLHVLKRRFARIPITIYPTQVQGEQAAPALRRALAQAQKHGKADVLILARGGGSLEDLWAFNDPQLVQDIFDCTIPVVSGVGHETDITLCDLVADLRAPTPSAAAELVSPDNQHFRQKLSQIAQSLQAKMEMILQNLAQRLDYLQSHLQHPRDRLRQAIEKNTQLYQKLTFLMQTHLKQTHFRFETLTKTLHTLSPLATLTRGYAIVTTTQHAILTRAQDVRIGEKVCIQLSQGLLNCKVDSKQSQSEGGSG